MTSDHRMSKFCEGPFKGSRLRCLLLTGQARDKTAGFFSTLFPPHVTVAAQDLWAPRGLSEPDEAKLGETEGFLIQSDRDALTAWWLAEPRNANTPHWDMVSTCRVAGRPGLILVEAKAHEGEVCDDHCGATNPRNRRRIQEALAEATAGWNRMQPGFHLSTDSHYQFSNRFAFAWKLATIGIPVVLVYLGFLDAHDMHDENRNLLMALFQCLFVASSLSDFGGFHFFLTNVRPHGTYAS